MQMNDIHSYRFRLKTVDRVYRFAVDTAGALLYYRLNCDLRTCRPCGLLLTVGLIITECTNLWNVYKKYFAVHSLRLLWKCTSKVLLILSKKPIL